MSTRRMPRPPADVVEQTREEIASSPTASRVIRWGIVAWSLIGVLALAYLLYRFVVRPVGVLFAPLLVALAIVYLLNPIVSVLQRRGVARIWGTLLTYVAFLTLVGILIRFVVPAIGTQVAAFAKSVPQLLERAQASLNDVLGRFDIGTDAASVIQNLGPQGGGGEFISRIFSVTTTVLHVVLIFLLGLVLGFYFLVDLPKIQRGMMSTIPAGRVSEVRGLLDRMGQALGGFFRGQLLVALFVGLASMLGLFIVGLPYWALVGAVAGLFNLIPLVGPFIGAVPALFIAFTTESSGGLLSLDPGWSLALGASLALLTVQQIDNHIISPNVVARTVRLHPVTVMLGLLVGGTWLGIWGMLLAIPTIAAVKILLLHLWDTRMQWPPKRSQDQRETGREGDGPGKLEAHLEPVPPEGE